MFAFRFGNDLAIVMRYRLSSFPVVGYSGSDLKLFFIVLPIPHQRRRNRLSLAYRDDRSIVALLHIF